MDEFALTALKGSIAKWEGIVAGTEVDHGADNCALCKAFPGCIDCPVANEVDAGDCNFTPWEDWYDAHEYLSGWTIVGLRAETDEQKRFAQEELNFLKSLLPSNENPSGKV